MTRTFKKRFLALVAPLAILAGPGGARADYEFLKYPSRLDPLPANGPKAGVDSTDTESEAWKNDIAIGFDFTWQGTTYKNITVSSNGAMAFERDCNRSFAFNNCMGDTPPGDFNAALDNDPSGYLAPWWGNLDIVKNLTSIRTYLEGANPNRIFTVEWAASAEAAVGSSIGNQYWFQVKLYETSNVAVVQYGPVVSGAHNGSVRFTSAAESKVDAQRKNATGSTFLSCGTGCVPGDFPSSQAIMVPTPSNAEIAPYVSFSNVSATVNQLSFTAKSEVYNAGRTSASGVSYKVYLSGDRTITAADDNMSGAADKSGISLAASASDAKSTTVTITRPKDGIYYLGMIASTIANEPIAANNTVSSVDEIVVGKDVIGTMISGATSSGPGEAVPLKLSVTNRGTDAANGFSYKVYLSADKVLGGTDKEVVVAPVPNVSLNPGETKTLNVTGKIPADSEGGNFYYILSVDSGAAIAEASETNNVSVGPLVLVTPPDLVMNAFTLVGNPTEVYYGRQLTAEIAISNVGGAVGRGFFTEFKASGEDGVLTAKDANVWAAPAVCFDASDCNGTYAGNCDLDTFQCKPACNTDAQCPDNLSCFNGACMWQLQPGESKTFRVTGAVPTKDGVNQKDLVAGDCLFGALINGNELVKEVPNGTANNYKYMTSAIHCRYPAADAVAREFFAPTKAAAGEAITVFRTIRNNGNDNPRVKDGTGKLVPGKIRYEYVLSWNDIVTPKDSVLTIVGKGAYGELDLAPGEEDQGVDQIVLPSNLAASTNGYRIGVIVDFDKQIDELDESNNVTVSPQPLTVTGGSLFIVQEALPTAVVGVPVMYQLRAIGGDGRYAWTLHRSSKPLPAGFTLSSSGLLQGALTEAALKEVDVTVPGNLVFSVQVQSGGATDVQTFLMPVVKPTGPLTIETGACATPLDADCTRRLPVAFTGRDYRAAIAASGGQPPYKWKVTASGNGITADGNVLSGTPDTPATLTIQAQVQDSRGISTTKQLFLRVVEPNTLTILTGALQDADVGVTYIGNFDAQGGNEATRQWYIDPSQLPPGLTYESGVRCKISGIPTIEGLYAFPVLVYDGDGNSDQSYFSIFVKAGKTFTIQTKALPGTTPGADYQFQLRATTAVTWAVVSGGLPEGLTLSESGEIAGTVSPTARTGVYPFSVAAIDASKSRVVASFGLNVKAKALEPQYDVKKTGCSTAGGGLPGFAGVLIVLAFAALRRRR